MCAYSGENKAMWVYLRMCTPDHWDRGHASEKGGVRQEKRTWICREQLCGATVYHQADTRAGIAHKRRDNGHMLPVLLTSWRHGSYSKSNYLQYTLHVPIDIKGCPKEERATSRQQGWGRCI